MSNALAIEVVTRGLIDFIQREVKRQEVEGGLPPLTLDPPTILPPTEVKPAQGTNHINLFLYHLAPNAAFRNGPMPGRGKPGEAGPAPLALNLYYLITIYSVAANEHPHHVLGRVMSALHLASPLSARDLKNLIPVERTASSGLADQFERVKLTPVALSPDEMSRLWSGFQTPYRLSVAYEASVVLIEALKATPAPLPVLTRGLAEPDGFDAISGMRFPALASARFEFTPADADKPVRQLDVGRIGDVLRIAGSNLVDADRDLELLFEHPRFRPRAVPIPRARIIEEKGVVYTLFTIPLADEANWPAGIYTVRARLQLPAAPEGQPPTPRRSQTTNAVTFALVPSVLTPDLPPLGASRVLRVPARPRIRAGQPASLLLGDVELSLGTLKEDASRLWLWYGGPEPAIPEGELVIKAIDRFTVEKDREYLIRLRVDGVDSLPFNPSSSELKYLPELKMKLSTP